MKKLPLVKLVSFVTLLSLSYAYANNQNMVSVAIHKDKGIEETLKIKNISGKEINSLNISPLAAANQNLSFLSISPGYVKPCQSISLLNPLKKNESCSIKIINKINVAQGVKNAKGTLVINANGKAQPLYLNVNSGVNLIAGGKFDNTGDGVRVNNIAIWNGQRWAPMNHGGSAVGVTGSDYVAVYTIDVSNTGELLIGGRFDKVEGKTVHNVAQYLPGSGYGWMDIEGGTNGMVRAVKYYKGDRDKFYVGGSYSQIGGDTGYNFYYVQHYPDTHWYMFYSLGANIDFMVDAIAIKYGSGMGTSGDQLFVGGSYGEHDPGNYNYIAGYDFANQKWYALGKGLDYDVDALQVSNNKLYVGGSFEHAGGQDAVFIAQWDGNNWSKLNNDLVGWTTGLEQVQSLAAYKNDLYLGGYFTTRDQRLDALAKWSNNQLSQVGGGISGYKVGPFVVPGVFAMANANYGSNNDLYIGGNFTKAGRASANSIVKWDGSNFTALGNGLNGEVYALAFAPYLDVTAQ